MLWGQYARKPHIDAASPQGEYALMSQAPTSTSNFPASAAIDPLALTRAKRWDILHWARTSYRYHNKRQWFFNFCDLLTQVICTLAGLAVFSDFFKQAWIAGAIVSVLSVFALVVRYGDTKQRHIDLGRRCQQLIADIEPVRTSKVTDDQLSNWARLRAQINGDEPATLRTLAAECEWEQAVEDGHPDHAPRPPLSSRMHMHLW